MEEKKEKLKVTGSGIEYSRGYLTVNYLGSEYRIPRFKFQDKESYKPEYLPCVIKSLGNNTYKISQDLVDVVEKLYKVGQTYPFTILGSNKFGYYPIGDENGLRFRMTEYDDEELRINQKVQCEVTSIKDGFHVFAKLVKQETEDEEKTFFVDMETLAHGMNLDEQEAGLLEETILSDPYFDDARKLYEANDGQWMLVAITKFDERLLAHVESREFLNFFKKFSLYLIERSHMVRELPDDERGEWMKKLTLVAQHAEDYQLANNLIDRGEEENYINEQLISLKESENLYQPDRKFRTILSIFNNKDKLMASKMDEIFDIILGGKQSHWQSEPFRGAFVNMLEIFISKYKDKAMSVGLSKLIKALAIQLLLSTEDDGLDRRLNRSMLYRFLACTKKAYSVQMLAKAFESLLTPYPKDGELDYEWEDISDINILYIVVAAKMQIHPLNNVYQLYKGSTTELLIQGNDVTIQPVNASYNKVDVVPKDQLQWHNLRVYLNEKTGVKLKGSKAISAYKEYWSAIEEALSTKTVGSSSRKIVKQSPKRGDYVYAWVERANEDYSSFLCHIDDDEFEGSGWLDLKQIVGYLNPSDNILECFKSPRGTQFLLPMKVISDVDTKGMLHFSMWDDICEVYSDKYSAGDVFVCKIFNTIPNYYIGVARNGISVRIPKDDTCPNLWKGDVVKACVSYMDSEKSQFVCDFVEKVDMGFNPVNSFYQLLQNMACEEKEDDDIDDIESMAEDMEKYIVREIIAILDRLAVLMPSRDETYNYLGVASILSRMINDPERVEYYRKRRSILELFDFYEKNGKIGEEDLSKIVSDEDTEKYGVDSIITDHVKLFKILNAIDDTSKLDLLYKILKETESDTVRRACAAAMSLSLLSEFNLPDAKKQVYDALNNEIGVKIRTSTKKDYGMETQTVEFKSSMVYPADSHMQPHPRLQEIEIMKVVCSFLNSDEGGTLYLGVNNYGVACGLQNDFQYLHNNDLESYSRYLYHKILSNFGYVASTCCHEYMWEKTDGYDVLKVVIRPSENLVKYNGKYYVRNNTEKRIIDEHELDDVRRHHSEAYAKWKKSSDNAATGITPNSAVEQENADAPTETQTMDYRQDTVAATPVVNVENVTTSKWRRNVVFEYEDGYGEGTVAFFHLYPDTFRVSDDGTYETTNLSLAIDEKEEDGYMAVVYESGNVLLVEMNDIVSKQRDKMYARCKSEKVKFMCPVCKDGGVLSVWRGQRNEVHLRIDEVSALVDNHHVDSMTSPGKPINEYMPEDGLLYVDIVSKEQIASLYKYCNNGNNLGQKTSRMPAKDADFFKKYVGIDFSQFE
jgi:hypothetical protein